MFKIGGDVGYRILRRCFPGSRSSDQRQVSDHGIYFDRLARIVGEDQLAKRMQFPVLDFGCGHGEGSVELARRGFHKVIGIDIRDDLLQNARHLAQQSGVSERCQFVKPPLSAVANTIISIDAFEHFDDPAEILKVMADLIVEDGCVIASFGPTWYHPKGGHLFSVFPWAHCIFSESSLCRWRRDFRDDGAMQFAQVTGGLNQMTIKRFEQVVETSPLRMEMLILRPIRSMRWLHCRWTREFTTAIVDCVLVKRGGLLK